jgi:RNA polymerase II elongation factor ELL
MNKRRVKRKCLCLTLNCAQRTSVSVLLAHTGLQSTILVDSNDLIPSKNGKRGGAKTANSSPFLNNKSKLFNASTPRSIPSSPALGAIGSPSLNARQAPTSVPTPNNLKLEALRTPLAHLLALGETKEADLRKKIRCSSGDLLQVLQRIGLPSRSGPGWGLSDRSYKELDVYKFPYPSNNDRAIAVANAVAAFDRLRLARDDKRWQLLLPKEERGKGKILSKLSLHTGPMQRATPTIQVTDERGAESDVAGNVSSQQNSIRKKAVEKSALGKDGLPKRKPGRPPKSAAAKAQDKETKAPKKKSAATQPEGKYKSAEVIVDSDSDIDMEDIVNPKPQEQKTVAPLTSHKSDVKDSKSITVKARDEPKKKVLPTKPKPQKVTRPVETVKAKPQAAKPVHKPQSQGSPDTSPQKRSPLGSTPPMNASDIDESSSSSSTPLMHQVRKNSLAAQHQKLNGVVRGVVLGDSSKNSLKRKADDGDRHYANSGSSQSSPSHNYFQPATKRHHQDDIANSPPSDSSLSTSPGLPSYMEKAQQFKKYHLKYARLYKQLQQSKVRKQDDLAKIKRMQAVLENLKQEIMSAAVNDIAKAARR